MVSLSLRGDAIVRSWFRSLTSPRWRAFWRLLLGDNPAPSTLAEAQARRHPKSALVLDHTAAPGVAQAQSARADAEAAFGKTPLGRVAEGSRTITSRKGRRFDGGRGRTRRCLVGRNG